MGEQCRVVDSAEACAQDVANQLSSAGLLRTAHTHEADLRPTLRLIASDESPRMSQLARRFLGERVREAKVIPPDRLPDESRAVVRRSVPKRVSGAERPSGSELLV
jgi:hypothetical protein